MHTDKNLLVKGIKYVSFTILLMFTAPVVMYQAFRNEEHAWFWPVAIAGMVLAIGAIALGFYSIKILLDAFFTKKKH